MKYAFYNGIKTRASDVPSGTIGNDLWYNTFPVKAHVGKYRQYWVYCDEKPELPEGYENESDWHASWKENLCDEFVEVVIGDGREHRADIFNGKQVIELQKSPIDIRAAKDRVNFYHNYSLQEYRVVWVINIEDAWHNVSTDFVSKNKFKINWKYKRNWVYDLAYSLKTDVYLEFNHENDKLIKFWIHDDEMYGSWFAKEKFFNEYLNDIAKPEFKDNSKLFVDELIKT